MQLSISSLLKDTFFFSLHIAASFYIAVIYIKLLSKLAAFGVNLESSFSYAYCKISIIHSYVVFFFFLSLSLFFFLSSSLT